MTSKVGEGLAPAFIRSVVCVVCGKCNCFIGCVKFMVNSIINEICFIRKLMSNEQGTYRQSYKFGQKIPPPRTARRRKNPSRPAPRLPQAKIP